MESKKTNITLKMPDEVLSLLQSFAQGKSTEDNVRILLAIGLFLVKSISLGEASEVARLSLNDFIFLLQANNLPWKSYCEDDLKYDELVIKEYYEEYENYLCNLSATASIIEKVNLDAESSIIKKLKFTVIIEKDEDGIYVATVPTLPGCHTQAMNTNELGNRICEAIKLCQEV